MSETKALVFHSPDQAPFLLTGFPWRAENGNFNRIPERLMPGLDKQLSWVAPQPSGGTIRFRSNSRRLALRVELTRVETYRFNTQNLMSGFDVYVDDGEGLRYVTNLLEEGNPAAFTAELPVFADNRLRHFVLYTPLQNPIGSVAVGLEDGAEVLPPPAFALDRPLLFYGSSITCGYSASRPGLTYPAQIARRMNADFINLGFGGAAKGELEIARAIASLDPACFVMDYDFNAPDAGHLRRTHKPFFDVVRAAHPTLPIVIVSAPYHWKNPEEFAERRAAVEDTWRQAVAAGDRHVWFLDGSQCFGQEPDWADYTVDALHPNDRGFQRMAVTIHHAMREAMGLE